MKNYRTGAAYISIPESSYLQYFTQQNDAYIKISPIFYTSEDFKFDYYSEGIPLTQSLLWDETIVENGQISVNLENTPTMEDQSVLIYNLLGDLLFEVDTIDSYTYIASKNVQIKYFI